MEKSLIVLKELAGNDPTSLNYLQTLLAPYSHWIILFWYVAWTATACTVVWKFIRDYSKN